MSRPVNYVVGCWPREMRAETAAAYADEPSVEAFLSKVEKGFYPAPAREPGMQAKWSREKLDAAISRRHGLDDNEDSSEAIKDLL